MVYTSGIIHGEKSQGLIPPPQAFYKLQSENKELKFCFIAGTKARENAGFFHFQKISQDPREIFKKIKNHIMRVLNELKQIIFMSQNVKLIITLPLNVGAQDI